MTEKTKLYPNKSLARFKRVYLFFLFLFLIGLLIGGKFLGNPAKKASPPLPPTPAILSLTAAKTGLKVGETIKVEVKVKQVVPDAMDLVISYNPRFFSISNLAKGAYPVYPQLFTDEKSGKIIVSATYDPQTISKKQKPPLTVASFNLFAKEKTAGESLSFISSQTNLAAGGENLPRKEQGLKLTVEPLTIKYK